MYLITDYLDQLDTDKNTLYNGLINAGVTASSDETFTTLTPKVNEITTNYASLFKPIINITGAGITDESFSQYPDKLEDGLINVLNNGTDVIFNNYPSKETKEGTSFTIYNTINAKMKINLKGNTSQNGTPTPSDPVEIKTAKGENHINKTGTSSDSYFITLPVGNKFKSIATQTVDDITLTNNGDGSYYLNGTSSESSIMFTESVNLPAGIYTINANNPTSDSNVRIRLESTDGSVNTVTCNSTYKSEIIGIKSRVTSISIWCPNAPSFTNFYLRPEIFINGYQDIELCKIGDYQDYIYKQNDKWYVHKEIGKVVLNGSETWSVTSLGSGVYRFQSDSMNLGAESYVYQKADGISNYFNYYMEYSGDLTNERIYCENQRVYAITSVATTSDNFNTWLSTHNTVIYYVLANSYNTQITDETLLNQLYSLENAKSNEGNTTLASYSDNNQEVLYLNATALKEESNNG